MAQHYVYILESQHDGILYIGYTTNPKERLKRHNQGRSKFTKSHRPWTLTHLETFPDKSTAPGSPTGSTSR